VAAGDGRVVEAHVRREAAANPGPTILEREHTHALVVLEGQVVALADERVARLLEPVGRPLDLVPHPPPDLVAEQGRAAEAHAPALGTRGDLVTFLQRDAETAGVTSKGPGTSERAGVEGFHSFLSSGGGGQRMVSIDTS